MRILLVKPPFNSKTFIQHFMVCEPLEFEVLASVIGSDHDVRIADLRVDTLPLAGHLAEFSPDVVGFTALTMDVNTVRALAKEVRRFSPEIRTCVGGEHASFCPDDFPQSLFDCVFQFDSAHSFKTWIDSLEHNSGRGQTHRMGSFHEPDDLDTLPLPLRHLTRQYLRRYTYGAANPIRLIQLTSGCSYGCTFCSIPARANGYQKRNIDRVLEDMAATESVDLLSIDANALQDIRHSERLYCEIAAACLDKRLMISCRTDTIVRHPQILDVLKQAGVSVIAFGIESLDNAWLADHNKRNTAERNLEAVRLVHSAGMLVRGNFIIDQQFSHDDFRKLSDDILSANIEFPSFQILTPLPGTALFKQLRDNLITTNFDYFDLSHSVLPTRLPLDVFHEEFRRLFRTCYGMRRLIWLGTKVPLVNALKGIRNAALSHLQFTYNSGGDLYASDTN
jgi:radical SAM superfamily enzyme YgiQ (UPF0313 family)